MVQQPRYTSPDMVADLGRAGNVLQTVALGPQLTGCIKWWRGWEMEHELCCCGCCSRRRRREGAGAGELSCVGAVHCRTCSYSSLPGSFLFSSTDCCRQNARVNKNKIHVMLKLFPNASILSKLASFPISIKAELIANSVYINDVMPS